MIDGTYAIARNNHNPMELPATVAAWDGDRLTVWDKVQSVVGDAGGPGRGARRARRPTCG